MNGRPANGIVIPSSTQKTSSPDWTIRLALAGAAGFAVLLGAFAIIAYRSLPARNGFEKSIASLNGKTDRVAAGQEVLNKELARIGEDLRADRAARTTGEADVALLRSRLNQIDTALTSIRQQIDAPAVGAVPQPIGDDPALSELRIRIDSLQRKLDQISAGTPSAPPQRTDGAASPLPGSVKLPGQGVQARPLGVVDLPARPLPIRTGGTPGRLNYPIDEIEQEVRDMQAVIRNARTAAPAVPVKLSVYKPLPTRAAGQRGANARSNGMALSPTDTGGPLISISAPAISRFPLESAALPVAQDDPPMPRTTRVGINTAQQSIGLLGLPFDALGNLLAAIGEGLDHLFTGREYVPRENRPTQARR